MPENVKWLEIKREFVKQQVSTAEMCEELLEAEQEAIISFVEQLEKEITVNSLLKQSLEGQSVATYPGTDGENKKKQKNKMPQNHMLWRKSKWKLWQMLKSSSVCWTGPWH